jgi:hypothetical protein
MKVRIRDSISKDVMPCSLEDGYKNKMESYTEEEGTMFHQNTGISLPDYKMPPSPPKKSLA